MSIRFGYKKGLVQLKYSATLMLMLIVMLSGSCRYGSSIRYQDGLKATDTYVHYPRKSTSYIRKGKVVYTDSLTGRLVKVEKYKTKNGCWRNEPVRHILITFDSTGKRLSRENLLRPKRCDTCIRTRRQIRYHW